MGQVYLHILQNHIIQYRYLKENVSNQTQSSYHSRIASHGVIQPHLRWRGGGCGATGGEGS
jgi:hypothetical protein